MAPPETARIDQRAGEDSRVLVSSAIFLAAAQVPAEPALSQPAIRINHTKRTLRFVVPITDNGAYLGEIDLAVDPEDRLAIKADRLLQLLKPVLQPEVHLRLETKVSDSGEITEAALAAEGIGVSYDHENLALAITVPVEIRQTSSLSLRGTSGVLEETLAPSRFSAFMNLRSAVDFIEHGPQKGFEEPVVLLDGAVRALGIVGESEGYLSFRAQDPLLRRTASRLVYDDRKRLVRFAAGDVPIVGSAFQSMPSAAGFTASRFYHVLEPWREFRSTGSQRFTITAPSMVETLVNGRLVERRRYQPGNYALSDFPLAEGANDIKLLIEDPTGRKKIIDFNFYSNRALLSPGATEFFVFAGVYSSPGRAGIHYSRDMLSSGFIRRGISQSLSAGLNFQADERTQQVGGEMVLGTALGLLGFDLAVSHRKSAGNGLALATTFEKILGASGEVSHALRAFAEFRSRHFSLPGSIAESEASAVRATFGYAVSLGIDRFVRVDGQYARNRLEKKDRYSLRLSGGLPLAPGWAMLAEAEWERSQQSRRPVFHLGIKRRIGARTSALLEANSNGGARASYQTSGGSGIGAWSASGDVNRNADSTTFNGTGTLLTNRLELGLSQLATYSGRTRQVEEVRTSLRAGTSIGLADGVVAIGRPIQESFLIAGPHRTLKGKAVQLDPQGTSSSAKSGRLGPALEGNLSAYSPRLVVYQVPDAPPGYDLGAGNVQLVPPYKAGYRLEVGSDYNLMVLGRLLDRDGEPISLLAGKAIDLGAPRRPAVTMFTSRNGRFGVQGLRPGRWRFEMPTGASTTIFEVVISDDPSGTVRLGDLHPLKQGDER